MGALQGTQGGLLPGETEGSPQAMRPTPPAAMRQPALELNIVRTHEPPVTKKANKQIDCAIKACSEALLGGMGPLGKSPFSNPLFTADFLGTIPFEHKGEDMQGKAKNALQGLTQGTPAKELRRSFCEAAIQKAPSATHLVCMRQIQNIHSTKWMNAWPNRPE